MISIVEVQRITAPIYAKFSEHAVQQLISMGDVAEAIDPSAGFQRFHPFYIINTHMITEDEFRRLLSISKHDLTTAYMVLRQHNLGITDRVEFLALLDGGNVHFENVAKDLHMFLEGFDIRKARKLRRRNTYGLRRAA